MDKTDFVKQLATLESLTDWEDGDAVLEALDTARREIYMTKSKPSLTKRYGKLS